MDPIRLIVTQVTTAPVLATHRGVKGACVAGIPGAADRSGAELIPFEVLDQAAIATFKAGAT